MSFDWAEYLSVAETLCRAPISGPPPGDEARQRAAVSRAYYAVYILARNRLRDIDHIRIPRGASPHKFVSDQYQSHADARRVQIGLNLRRLKAARVKCDYEDAVSQLPLLADWALARAALVVTDLARL